MNTGNAKSSQTVLLMHVQPHRGRCRDSRSSRRTSAEGGTASAGATASAASHLPATRGSAMVPACGHGPLRKTRQAAAATPRAPYRRTAATAAELGSRRTVTHAAAARRHGLTPGRPQTYRRHLHCSRCRLSVQTADCYIWVGWLG